MWWHKGIITGSAWESQKHFLEEEMQSRLVKGGWNWGHSRYGRQHVKGHRT